MDKTKRALGQALLMVYHWINEDSSDISAEQLKQITDALTLAGLLPPDPTFAPQPPTSAAYPLNAQIAAKLPIDRPCSACSAGDTEMKHHDHHPPFSAEPVGLGRWEFWYKRAQKRAQKAEAELASLHHPPGVRELVDRILALTKANVELEAELASVRGQKVTP